MTQTALGEKLQRGGFIPHEVRFSVAIAEFLNNGGTIERAHELIAIAADKMGSGGQVSFADKAGFAMPPSSQPNGSEGHTANADKASTAVPSLPPSISEAGQILRAHQLSPNRDGRGQSPRALSHAKVASPAREPSAADRAARASVAKEAAVAVLTVFDRYKVRDGRSLKKLRYHELMKLAQEDESEARAFRYMVTEVESKFANPDHMALVPDLVSAETAEKAFAFARMAANAQ